MDPYGFVEAWCTAHGTEDYSAFPTFPAGAGNETPAQLQAQDQLLRHYLYCDQQPWMDPAGKRALLRHLVHQLETDRQAVCQQYGAEYAMQLEIVLKRSVLVRSECAVQKLTQRLEAATAAARRSPDNSEICQQLEKVTSELKEARQNIAADAPVGWVWRQTSDGAGVYINLESRVAQRENPRTEDVRRAAEHLDGKNKAIDFLKEQIAVQKTERAEEVGALKSQLAELEARPPQLPDGPVGTNFLVCPACRTLLWCERPGGHGEFDVVDSVACAKCDVKTYHCIPCAEQLGWQLMRKSAVCAACAVGA